MVITPEPPACCLHAVAKFNPHLWEGSELRACFVARQRELAKLLEVVRETPPGAAPQHWLVVGLRGMGKSTLLQRLALAVDEEKGLSDAWYALVFPEEQYTVACLADFWSNCLDALADALQRRGEPMEVLAKLDGQIAELETRPEVERENAALTLLLDTAHRHGRRLLLLVDSLDLLLASLGGADIKPDAKTVAARDGGAAALWRLRQVLSETPDLLVVGAAYQALEATQTYDAAFHDFFASQELRPLSTAEMREILLALARQFGAGLVNPTPEQAAAHMQSRIDAHPGRLEALRDLTGGNPRTTVMLYELFSAGGTDNVRADLERLLDQVTPLYKARMEMLPDQQRQLLAHLMQAWAPQTARQLADLAHLPVTTVNGQLRRLELDGLVQKTSLPGKARFGYQTAERFFNIWYLMRNASRRVRQRLLWIIEFLKIWYSNDELRDLARRRVASHNHGQSWHEHGLEYSRALAAAMPDCDERRHLDLTLLRGLCCNDGRRRYLADLYDFDGEDRPLLSEKEYHERLAGLDAKILLGKHPELEQQALDLIKGIPWRSLSGKEKLADKLSNATKEQYKAQLLDLQKDAERSAQVAGQEFYDLLNTAVRNGTVNLESRSKDLLEVQIKEELPKPRVKALAWTYAGRLIGNKSNRDFDREYAFRKAIDASPGFASPWNNLGIVLADDPKKQEEAEAAYRKAIELNSGFSWLWNNLGNLLAKDVERLAEAEASYRKAIEINSEYAVAWLNLGRLLANKLHRYDEAEAAYRKAIDINPKYAWAWALLGELLAEDSQRRDEAEVAYRKATDIDQQYAWAWVKLGELLARDIQRHDEAEADYRKAVEINQEYALAWGCLGKLLEQNPSRAEEAEAAYRKATAISPTYVWAWRKLGELLENQLQRYDQAEAAYLNIAELEPVNFSIWNTIGLLRQFKLKQLKQAEAAYRQGLAIQANCPYLLINLGCLLVGMGRQAEAAEYLRRVLDNNPSLAESDGASRAAITALAHLGLDNRDAAAQALDSLLEPAAQGNEDAFERCKEMSRVCLHMNKAAELVELLETSPWAAFAQPFALALSAAAANDANLLNIAPPEVRLAAAKVLDWLQGRDAIPAANR